MQLIDSPYLHVQRIARERKDKGQPVRFAKPGVYSIVINLPANTVGETVGEVWTVDEESDFVWVGTYHYWQNAAWTPEVTVAGNPGSGYTDPQGGAGSVWRPSAFEIQLKNLSTGRPYHSPEFIRDMPWGDREQGRFSGAGIGGADEISEIGSGVSEGVIGLWRFQPWEPEFLPARHQTRITLRRQILDPTGAVLRGHVFLFSGVRLYPSMEGRG